MRPAVSMTSRSKSLFCQDCRLLKTTEPGSAPRSPLTTGMLELLPPQGELGGAGGAEGVGRGQEHAAAAVFEIAGQLGGAGRLAAAVDPDQQDDVLVAGGQRGSARSGETPPAVPGGGAPWYSSLPEALLAFLPILAMMRSTTGSAMSARISSSSSSPRISSLFLPAAKNEPWSEICEEFLESHGHYRRYPGHFKCLTPGAPSPKGEGEEENRACNKMSSVIIIPFS